MTTTKRMPWWFTELKMLGACEGALRRIRQQIEDGRDLPDIIRSTPYGDLGWFLGIISMDSSYWRYRFEDKVTGEVRSRSRIEYLIGDPVMSSRTRLEHLLLKHRNERLLQAQVERLEKQVEELKARKRRRIAA